MSTSLSAPSPVLLTYQKIGPHKHKKPYTVSKGRKVINSAVISVKSFNVPPSSSKLVVAESRRASRYKGLVKIHLGAVRRMWLAGSGGTDVMRYVMAPSYFYDVCIPSLSACAGSTPAPVMKTTFMSKTETVAIILLSGRIGRARQASNQRFSHLQRK